MAINSVGSGASALAQSVRTLTDRLDTLQTQLTTGKKSTSYAGMGINEGFAIAARAQLSGIDAFTDTMMKVDVNINVTNTALQSMVKIGTTVQTAAASITQTLGANGQTLAQQNATAQLSSMLGILNTQAGDRFVFSGSATTTAPVASTAAILDGAGGAAGLKQLIAERRQADLGVNGLGRLTLAQPNTTSVSVSEDVAGSPFGMKLAGITSTSSGATLSGPTGSPPSISIDLGAGNPADGQSVTFKFAMPDGTSETMTLTATTVSPPPAGGFTIGATTTDTATNLKTALTASIGKLANTSLVAASAMQAADNFFGTPPLRVSGTPANATALVAGTSANTVSWYLGEAGSGPARASAVARVDPSVVVSYGARANEDAIRNQLKSIAAYAAVTSSPSDPNAAGQIAALSQRVWSNLSVQTGQRMTDIQADFSTTQIVMKDAKSRQGQTRTMLQSVVDQAETISPNEVATQLLALQTSLQASYQTTAMLAQLSLIRFI